MAKLTKQDVLHVAYLARLDLTDTEVDKYVNELSPVIDYINELGEVNTQNTESTWQPTNGNVLREDEIDTTNYLSTDEALSGTENTQNNYIVVPQILRKN